MYGICDREITNTVPMTKNQGLHYKNVRKQGLGPSFFFTHDLW